MGDGQTPAGATTVLVVDDERGFAEGLVANLEREGYRTLVAHDGETALARFEAQPVDVVLLDLMLPGMDGMEVCRRLRRRSQVPIIMLTARDDDIDKVLGLEVGADDYLTKPFHFRELLARIRAILRRVGAPAADGPPDARRAVAPGVILDGDRQALVAADGTEVPLTVKEFGLLELMARHPGRVFSRDELLSRVWGYEYFGTTRTVDVHVMRLRHKLESLPGVGVGSAILRTRWGAGYLLAGSGPAG